MDNQVPRINVETADDFVPSNRVREALEELAAAYDVELGGDEVQGFKHDGGLSIGRLDVSSISTTTSFRDGCWGYSTTNGGNDGSCSWHQKNGDQCLGHSW